MVQYILRFGTGVAFLMILLTPMAAQQPPKQDKEAPRVGAINKDVDDYRQFFKKPDTVDEYWKAMQFEIDVGEYPLAAQLLHGLVLKKPGDADLLALEAKYGMAAFLKLRTLPPLRERGREVPRWSDDPKMEAQTRDDIEKLINDITAAVKGKLARRDQIVKYVRALTSDPEEASFALRELFFYRSAVVPPLVDELRASPVASDERRTLTRALIQLPDVVPPLLAAFDSNDPALIEDVIAVCVTRSLKDAGVAKEVVPNLWYLSASPTQSDSVRAKATAALALFLKVPASKLPPAKFALTREAERYFQHQVSFVDPNAVKIWRWEKTGIVLGWPGAELVSQTKAEEYYGLRYARQALALDPAYQPAQETLLSIAIDKALEKADLSQPLSKSAPAVHELLAASNPEILTALLERAMTEKRTNIVLACVRAIGEQVEVRASKPTGHGDPALVRALSYGDKRVAMSAAESLLRMPSPPSLAATRQILDILRLNLAVAGQASGKPKVIVASGDNDSRLRIAKTVEEANYEAVSVATGRDALRRLNSANDISAIVMESTLPDPGLASFLAQVHADVHTSQLPIIMVAVPDSAESRSLILQYREERDKVQDILARTAPYRKERLNLKIKYEKERDALLKSGAYETETARQHTLLLLDNNHREDLADLAIRMPEASILDKRVQEVEKRLSAISDRYSAEALRREDALKRWLEASPTITVVSTGFLDDPKNLEARLHGEMISKPLTAAEETEYAEKAIRYFARMARGEIAGYDLKSEDNLNAIYNALHGAKLSEKGQADALDIVVRQSAGRAQNELAAVVLDAKRPLPLRLKATDELIKHIQENSRMLSDDLVARLRKLYEETGMIPEQKDFKAKLAVLQGSFRPDQRSNGERLRDYQPPSPGPAAPLPPPPKADQ